MSRSDKIPKATAGPSAFERALDEYVKSRPKKSKTPQFIRDLQQQQRSGIPLDGNAVKEAMVQLGRDATDRTAAHTARKVLRGAVLALSTYSGVIDTLVQADPMPTAIVWGCLRAVIDCSTRFLELYDKIEDQVKHLNTHITVLAEYEELFDHSSTMVELLQASYIDIIRFWRRVEKECNRCVTNRMVRAVVPFSTAKLDEVIASIGKNADRMSLLVPAVQERLTKGERENAAEERRLAGLAREEQTAFFQLHAEELKRRNEERKSQRLRDVRKWCRSSSLNASNFRHQNQNARLRSPGTCEWLFANDSMKNWVDSDTPASQLWVKASPGVGKSVLSAYAIDQVAQITPDTSATIYQYYTFDEEFQAIQVYRCLAEQLANRLWTLIGDMPEQIHAYTQRSSTSAKAEDVKAVIRMLVEHISTTYIFLDGLDEECDHGPRLGQLSDVLDFFAELASQKPRYVRLWCSSQHRTCLDHRLKGIPSIEVTKNLNSYDIEMYLSEMISGLDNLELHQGYKTLILKDLHEKADGCFLWASLMLHSISSAATLRTVQEHIRNGLPKDCEKYYQRKIESVEDSQRPFVSYVESDSRESEQTPLTWKIGSFLLALFTRSGRCA
jgi:Cdc6-like AAA superfamily ATPase